MSYTIFNDVSEYNVSEYNVSEWRWQVVCIRRNGLMTWWRWKDGIRICCVDVLLSFFQGWRWQFCWITIFSSCDSCCKYLQCIDYERVKHNLREDQILLVSNGHTEGWTMRNCASYLCLRCAYAGDSIWWNFYGAVTTPAVWVRYQRGSTGATRAPGRSCGAIWVLVVPLRLVARLVGNAVSQKW